MSDYVVVKGQPKCISKGFDRLKKNAISMKVRTVEYEKGKKRKFNLVDVQEYDPVSETYSELGKFWADVVTGTLYDPKTGECQSSTQISLIV